MPPVTWRTWLARAAAIVGLLAAGWGVLARWAVLIGVTTTLFTVAAAAFLFAIFVLLDEIREYGLKGR